MISIKLESAQEILIPIAIIYFIKSAKEIACAWIEHIESRPTYKRN